MAGIVKEAFDRSSFGSPTGRSGVVTFGDVYDEIRGSRRLSLREREQVVSGVKALTGSPKREEPLARAFATPAGAAIGALAANHFKLGPVGTAILAGVGADLGSKFRNRGISRF